MKLMKLRRMKKNTRFFFIDSENKKQQAIAKEKRGYHSRDCLIIGKKGVYGFRSEEVFELV